MEFALAIHPRHSSITTMQLEAIKVFCDLASMRSFSKAAAANGKSQPAVSRIVHELEIRLRGRLIDRSHRPLRLTPLGEAYYEGCKRLLEQYLELEASLLRAPPTLAMPVRVAAIYSVGLGDMGQYVERFEAAHPHVQVRVDYLHPDRVYEHVRDGSADFGLVSFPRSGGRDLAILPWREEEMVVACAPDHPLAGLPVIPPADLAGQPYVHFDKGLAIRREIDRFLREQGVSVDVAFEFDSVEHIKQGIIEAGAGLALLPEPTIRKEVQAGTLRALRLEGARFVRPIGIIHRRRTPPGSAARDFIDLLRGVTAHPPADSTNAPIGNGAANGAHTSGFSPQRTARMRTTRTVS
jgi:DNA-binding transcriptional LysR family regulator